MRGSRGYVGAACFTWLTLLPTMAGAVSRSAAVLLATHASAAEGRAAVRLNAELQSAGYRVYATDAAVDVTCTADAAVARSLESYGESAWAQLAVAPSSSNLTLSICYRDDKGRLSEATVSIAIADVDRGALASVEALNGLRAQPANCAPCEAPKPRPAPPPPVSPPAPISAVSVGAAVVFDPLGVGPVAGITALLKSGLTQRFALSLNGFVPARPHRITHADRAIDVDVAWLRAGPTLSWPLWIANVNASLAAGPALVWAESRARAPLIGSASRSAAFVVSAGGALELPRDSAWVFCAYYEAGAIFPRVNIVTAPNETEHFGPLLFELGASLGVRWGG